MGWLQIILALLAFLSTRTPDNSNDVRTSIADDLGSTSNPSGDVAVIDSLGSISADSEVLPDDISETGLDDDVPKDSVNKTFTRTGDSVDDPFVMVGTSAHGGVEETSSPIEVETDETVTKPLIVNKDGTPFVVPPSSTTAAALSKAIVPSSQSSTTAVSGTSTSGSGGFLSQLGSGTAALLGFGAGAATGSSSGIFIIVAIIVLLLVNK